MVCQRRDLILTVSLTTSKLTDSQSDTRVSTRNFTKICFLLSFILGNGFNLLKNSFVFNRPTKQVEFGYVVKLIDSGVYCHNILFQNIVHS